MFYHITFFTFGSIVETIFGRSLWIFGPSNRILRLIQMIFSSSEGAPNSPNINFQNIQKLIKLSTTSSAKRIVNEMKSRRAFPRPTRRPVSSATAARLLLGTTHCRGVIPILLYTIFQLL